ncbi:hypothetical protein [Virgibacillus sp. DJP39]|uniref:hypothetical protein n=1 Tax=Virgibacillus sp. DJP39 TaxID=3409790 RepID=UPI003BB7A27D
MQSRNNDLILIAVLFVLLVIVGVVISQMYWERNRKGYNNLPPPRSYLNGPGNYYIPSSKNMDLILILVLYILLIIVGIIFGL